MQRGASRLDLASADRIGAVQDLPLQVGEIDGVGVGDREPADAGPREVQRSRRAQPAGADDQRV